MEQIGSGWRASPSRSNIKGGGKLYRYTLLYGRVGLKL